MPNATPSTPRSKPAPYVVGQLVDVELTDFDTPGFPRRWYPATVTEVEPRDDGKLFDVQVLAERGTWHPQIVGPRRGNRRLRPR